MPKKSADVYVVAKNNKLHKLSEYNLFVRKECAKMKKNGIRISGRGNLITHISKLWQQKKMLEANTNTNEYETPNKKAKIYREIDDLTSMISNVKISFDDDLDILTSMISNVNLKSNEIVKIKNEDI